MFIEILGYIGMAFILISFLMKDIKWVRIINICGALLSMTYGFLTVTYPTAILNLMLFIINSVFVTIYIIKERKIKNDKN